MNVVHDCPIWSSINKDLPSNVTMVRSMWRCPVCGQRFRFVWWASGGGSADRVRGPRLSWRWAGWMWAREIRRGQR